MTEREETVTPIEERVANGAKVLDEHVPGWAGTVRGAMTDGYFNIQHWDHCVAGSLEMVSYDTSVEPHPQRVICFNGTQISASGQEAVDLGFFLHYGGDENEGWIALDEAWRVAVAERVGE
jgi:hypothetical protein